jgi:pilus assembly protein Flp/PilA
MLNVRLNNGLSHFRVELETDVKSVVKVLKDEEGATAIEYGLIAALIAVAAIVAMNNLGKNLTNTFNKVNNSLKTANAAA